MKIALGADHAGYQLKGALQQVLEKEGHQIVDFGTSSGDSVDYPDYAVKVAQTVASGQCDRGILACGTGIGMAIAANKVAGIRAAAPWSVETAKLASEHNWSNVLCLSGRFSSVEESAKIVKTWLSTPWDKTGRHERRIKKISELETKR